MTSDVQTDPGTVAEETGAVDNTSQLTVNIGFHSRPVFVDPDDSSNEPTVKEGPPFVRFPVQLGAKDAGLIQQFLTQRIAFVAFEIQDADRQPRYYRLVCTRD